jgi:hypothetical protein
VIAPDTEAPVRGSVTPPVGSGHVRFAVWFALATAVLASAFGVVFSETFDVHAAAAEVAVAIAVAGLGIAVVPVTQLLVPPERPAPPLDAARAVPLAAALLSAAAGAIHFASIDEQSAGYWLFYLLFALLSVFQLAWAMLLFVRPSRLVYAVGALANAGTVAVWAISRTAGFPVGPMAGKPESLAFADVTATVFEVLLVAAIAVALARRVLRPPRGAAAATASLLLTLLLLAPTALALISAVGTHLLVPPSD